MARQPRPANPGKPQIDTNLERVRELLRRFCRIAVVDQRDGERTDSYETYATPGGLIVLWTIHATNIKAVGHGVRHELQSFEVLRQMGADNKMDTLLREIRELAQIEED